MTLWEERAARNEALFREVNERVEDLHDSLASGSSADFVCECADDTCTQRITLPIATYERASEPTPGSSSSRPSTCNPSSSTSSPRRLAS